MLDRFRLKKDQPGNAALSSRAIEPLCRPCKFRRGKMVYLGALSRPKIFEAAWRAGPRARFPVHVVPLQRSCTSAKMHCAMLRTSCDSAYCSVSAVIFRRARAVDIFLRGARARLDLSSENENKKTEGVMASAAVQLRVVGGRWRRQSSPKSRCIMSRYWPFVGLALLLWCHHR